MRKPSALDMDGHGEVRVADLEFNSVRFPERKEFCGLAV
jgi:hypothetical protein